jgi:hypothetical protein
LLERYEKNRDAALDAKEAAEQELQKARELLSMFDDGEECSYDHHGYCQTHSFVGNPCPVNELRAFLATEKEN